MAGTVSAAAASVLGRRIHYVSGGSGEALYVFVHGFGADHTTWRMTLPHFVERGRILALDLPGHGLSGVDVGPGTVAFFADQVEAWLDAAGTDRFHLVGHSLGGAIATRLAGRRPQRVISLTLIAPIGFGPPINRTFIARFPHLRDPAEARSVLSLLVANPRLISDQMVTDTLAFVGRAGVSAALETVAANLASGDSFFPLRAEITALAAPPRIIWGAEDRILPPPGDGGGAPVEVIPRAGHLVQMEASAKVNRLVAPPVVPGG
ncbi:MAG TPA: alpha/beta fold hydrolase [Bauldia sp.]|nr:alpha/beta fold hydrolase [Bauldia sp.]